MIKFLARVLVNGFLLSFVLPSMFSSIAFHGGFWPEGVIAGFVFAVTVVLVELLLLGFGILTLGFGFLLRWLLWFLVPALQLWAMAEWFPQYLSIESFFPSAFLAGLVLLLVNAFTNSTPTGATRS